MTPCRPTAPPSVTGFKTGGRRRRSRARETSRGPSHGPWECWRGSRRSRRASSRPRSTLLRLGSRRREGGFAGPPFSHCTSTVSYGREAVGNRDELKLLARAGAGALGDRRQGRSAALRPTAMTIWRGNTTAAAPLRHPGRGADWCASGACPCGSEARPRRRSQRGERPGSPRALEMGRKKGAATSPEPLASTSAISASASARRRGRPPLLGDMRARRRRLSLRLDKPRTAETRERLRSATLIARTAASSARGAWGKPSARFQYRRTTAPAKIANAGHVEQRASSRSPHPLPMPAACRQHHGPGEVRQPVHGAPERRGRRCRSRLVTTSARARSSASAASPRPERGGSDGRGTIKASALTDAWGCRSGPAVSTCTDRKATASREMLRCTAELDEARGGGGEAAHGSDADELTAVRARETTALARGAGR